MTWRTVTLAAATLAAVPATVALTGGTLTPAGVGALVPALVVAVLCAPRWPVPALLAAWAVVAAQRSAGLVETGWVWPATAVFVLAVLAGRASRAYLIGASALLYAANWEATVAGRSAEWVATHLGAEALWLIAVLAAATAYRDRQRWHAEATARQRQAEHQRAADEARRRAEERVQIARDLHDVVAHTLAVVGVHLNVALDTLDTDPDEAMTALRLAQQVRSAAMTDLKSLVGVLRDRDDDSPPVGDLDRIDDLVDRAGLAVTLDESGQRSAVPTPVAQAVYRIVQEALTNCLRHTTATRVHVVLRYTPDQVTVEVSDDGPVQSGPGSSPGPGHGIAGMGERAAALGGTLTAGPADGGGFTVHATIPTGGTR